MYSIKNLNLSILLTVFLFSSLSFSQWSGNPSENTSLVDNVSDPVNIITVSDNDGGFFLIWQDTKHSFQNEILFMHIDNYGKISFDSDGKEISSLPGEKVNPVAVPVNKKEAVVFYKDFSESRNGNIYVQKVDSKGNQLFGETGLQVTNTSDEIIDYTAAAGKNGETFLLFSTRGYNGIYSFNIQKISHDGKLIFAEDSLQIYKSEKRMIMPSLISDVEGNLFLLWMETVKSKSILFSLHLNSSGKPTWKKSIIISNNLQNVVSYSAECSGLFLYIAWQLQKEKEIYHQVLTSDGNILWNNGGKPALSMKGDESNPQVLSANGEYILSWINEYKNDKNIYVQKYDNKGNEIWKKPAVPVIELNGAQFGQKLASDKKGGVIVTWIDRRNAGVKGNIYAQRILSNGNCAWDSLGLPVALSYDNLKSYLSIIPDNENGAVVVFKEKRNEISGIFAHKIFNTGTYVSHILGFSTELINDSVKISWYCANELPETYFDIERTVYSDTSDINWQFINSYFTKEKSEAKYYEFFDKPDVSGTLYYRIVQRSSEGEMVQSEISKINYFAEPSGIVVAQNFPNPFSDSTVISFYLPTPQKVKVEYFNYRLEKIKEEAEKDYPAGENFITFFAEGFQSGVYFYKIITENFVDVKKMVLAQ